MRVRYSSMILTLYKMCCNAHFISQLNNRCRLLPSECYDIAITVLLWEFSSLFLFFFPFLQTSPLVFYALPFLLISYCGTPFSRSSLLHFSFFSVFSYPCCCLLPRPRCSNLGASNHFGMNQNRYSLSFFDHLTFLFLF